MDVTQRDRRVFDTVCQYSRVIQCAKVQNFKVKFLLLQFPHLWIFRRDLVKRRYVQTEFRSLLAYIIPIRHHAWIFSYRQFGNLFFPLFGENLSLSTECIAALLAFRYPSYWIVSFSTWPHKLSNFTNTTVYRMKILYFLWWQVWLADALTWISHRDCPEFVVHYKLECFSRENNQRLF